MLKLLSCGHNFTHEDGIVISRPNGSGDYAFVFFKSKAELVVNGEHCTVGKNDYILLRPDTSHSYRHLEKPFINDWFHCTGAHLDIFLSEIGFPLDSLVHAEDSLLITKNILELSSFFRQNNSLKDRIVDCDLQSLFMKMIDLQNKTTILEKTSRYFHSFSELRNELYNSPGTTYSIEKLASKVNLSKSYFQFIYKKLFGCSVISDLIHARLDYAKYLLKNSPFTVTTIAKKCGYENNTHFMRQFKKFVGVTPSQYKDS